MLGGGYLLKPVVREPQPGSVQDRRLMSINQPGFFEAYRESSLQAHGASCKDGSGGTSHSSVQSWGRFVIFGLKLPCMLRPLDPMATPLRVKLSEVDIVEAWAYWLVKHGNCNTETAWSYVLYMNAWHRRSCGVGIAGDFTLRKV